MKQTLKQKKELAEAKKLVEKEESQRKIEPRLAIDTDVTLVQGFIDSVKLLFKGKEEQDQK